jgi:CshA-type fibril repeat protein
MLGIGTIVIKAVVGKATLQHRLSDHARMSVWGHGWLLFVVLALLTSLFPRLAHAEDTVCARVKIEIRQELTLERQAFDAEMKINNTTDTGVIENVSVVVKVTDENGTPVAVTDNPNDLSAKFFLRLSSKQNIDAVDGTGTVSPKTTSTIDWLLIPSPGSAGISPLGKKYLVGATLTYRFGGEDTVLEVSPDVITVKPLPLLTLDYFLTQDVWGDDPLTPAVEPVEPFTLGVRVKNTGHAAAKNLKIDSAQPKIIENNQGLLINFTLTGSFVDDAPAQNTLLINFGEIAASSSKMGRWDMEATLAGKFTEFTAKFSHSDELGGSLTSILQATNPHFLIRDVRVDLPGRDAVRDFLARDGDVVRVYESDSTDTEVADRSSAAVLTAGITAGGSAGYRLGFPATAGFVYVKRPDPFSGQKALGQMVRSDGKVMGAENIWLSKTRNAQSKQVEYWVNVFDVNSTGLYDARFESLSAAPRPPVVQFIPGRKTQEQTQVSFLVEASSPDGRPVTLSATPLPAGATLTPQAADPQAPGVARAIFDWTPARNTAGDYLIVYSASDGTLNASNSATITVEAGTVGSSVPPMAGNDGATTRKDVNVTLDVLANDSFAPGTSGLNLASIDLDPSTPSINATRTVPGEGTFTANPAGTVTFNPLPSFTGLCTIQYWVKDNVGQATNTANLTVTVTGPGNPAGDTAVADPVANPDIGTTLPNTPITLDIKLNDVAGPGQTLDVASVDLDTATDGVQSNLTKSEGTWQSNGDGRVTFSPAANFTGFTHLTYAIADSVGNTTQSTVTVAVAGGAIPLAQNDSGSTLPSTPITLAILGNDNASTGQAVNAGMVDLNPATPDQLDGTITTDEGDWMANSNGTVTFTPTADFQGSGKPFTGTTRPLNYSVADSGGLVATAAISIAVNPTAAPTMLSDSANTPFNTPVSLNPAGNDQASLGATLNPTTLDLDPGTAAVEQNLSTADGAWAVNGDGTVTFTPAFNFTGTTAAQPYLIRDSLGHSANAYLNVTVAQPVSVTVSGTVFRDANLDQLQDGAEAGINAGGRLHVTAVNAGFPVATAAVAVDGGYTLALT